MPLMPRATAKICGLSTPETLDAALAGGASHVGFVFFPPSPRDVSPERAHGLVARLAGRAVPVGVFVDPDDALLDAAAAAGLAAIQLHGSEPPERAAAIGRRLGLEVWKAIPVRTAADVAGATRYATAADRILFDAKPPAGSALPGGMGLRFDWQLLAGYRHALPWALSGGIGPDSVAEAIGTTGATLVDVSSGVETAPGVKSVDLIAGFCQAVARL